jgi:hypothetical protein
MIHNVHERTYPVSPARLGELLDNPTGSDSPLWPVDRWPPMILDRPLGVGATGGHGPIRYRCTAYEPGRRAEFTFMIPIVTGTHTLEVDGSTLRHTIHARPRGLGHVVWPLFIRWLHDACLEDLLDHAAVSLGHPPAHPNRWSPYVRLLRHLAKFVQVRDRPKNKLRSHS